jgi:glycosyltransferase involved in cell wall biosynthesis
MVGTRFAGLDGVSLEAAKVAQVLESLGHNVSWFGGRVGPEFSPAVEAPDACFDTTHNLETNEQVFGAERCSQAILDQLEQRADDLRQELADYVAEFEPDVLMPQNALAIPMSLPLGMAIASYLRDTAMPMVAHHHDFAWERARFWPNAVGPLLDDAFPPTGSSLSHLVINSLAGDELFDRRGVVARLLPNIMDFENPPAPGDGAVFRAAAGLSVSDVVVLQSTRMIPRKGIEDTLELVHRLADDKIRVVVTHPEPDEGVAYVDHLVATADRLGVDFRITPVGPGTGVELADAYAAANLVTYPSRIEGFGNALLEAFYYKRPVLVNRYPVYTADIGPKGVAAIEMAGAITDGVVAAAAGWLSDPAAWAGAVEMNYEIGLRHYSFAAAADVLSAALADVVGG